MIHYDNLIKAEKMGYFSDYETMLFARAKGKIKTITGVLPLTFTAKGGTAADWVIEGNDENGTENLLDISDKSITSNNDFYAEVSISEPDIVSYFNQHIGDTFSFAFDIITEYSGSVQKEMVIYFADSTFATVRNNLYITITKAIIKIGIRARYDNPAGNGINYTFNHFMIVKGSTPPDHYIPYQQGVGEQRVDGYYVPLTISQAGQTDKTYDIYIGDSPLTEGETVSKTSTGIDIELFEGENTVSTTLYNKPEMKLVISKKDADKNE